jgi:putative transposase
LAHDLVNESPQRLNKESKRRRRVGWIFPNDTAVLRLTGAIVLDTHEEWLATDRRYLSETSMAKRSPQREDTEAVTGELDPAPAA